MPATSKAQQRAAGTALAAKRGKIPVSKLRGSALQMYKSMTATQLGHFAGTPLKGLPIRKKKKMRMGKRVSKAMKKAIPKKKWSRKVDKKMRNYGDIDFQKKKIRVNPKKRELLNTVIHEETHKRFPGKTEKEVKKMTKRKETNLSVKKAMGLLKPYKGRT